MSQDQLNDLQLSDVPSQDNGHSKAQSQPPNPNQNIEQQIHDIFHLMRTRVARGAEITLNHVTIAERNALALISKQVSEARIKAIASYKEVNELLENEIRIDELQTLMAKHTRTYKQTVTDSNGNVYVDDSHGYISKYETQERIAELKQTPPTPNGDEQGALANPSTPTALSKQADNLIEQLAAIEHERWSDWQRWVHSTATKLDGGCLEIHAPDVQHWERQIATPYSELTETEKQSDRDQVMRYWPLIEAWVNGLVENEPLASKDGAKKPHKPCDCINPTAPTSVNREKADE